MGQCAPQRKTEGSRPAFASIRSTPATCAASPLCEAQASANSSSAKPKRSAAPCSTSGKACNALTAERGKIGVVTSPMASAVLPSASLTATAPRWRLSTSGPRITSTRTGLAILAIELESFSFGALFLRRNGEAISVLKSLHRCGKAMRTLVEPIRHRLDKQAPLYFPLVEITSTRTRMAFRVKKSQTLCKRGCQ